MVRTLVTLNRYCSVEGKDSFLAIPCSPLKLKPRIVDASTSNQSFIHRHISIRTTT